jgi:hypothetical protein
MRVVDSGPLVNTFAVPPDTWCANAANISSTEQVSFYIWGICTRKD